MVAAVISILCTAVSTLLLWQVSPILALSSAPFIASACVLVTAALVARRRTLLDEFLKRGEAEDREVGAAA